MSAVTPTSTRRICLCQQKRKPAAPPHRGVLFILLALAAVAVLGVYICRQLQPPKAPETAIGYVASETASAPVYDADSGAELGVLVRGSQVAYVAADVETPREDGRVRVVNGEGYVLLDASIWPMISAGRYRWRRCTLCGA